MLRILQPGISSLNLLSLCECVAEPTRGSHVRLNRRQTGSRAGSRCCHQHARMVCFTGDSDPVTYSLTQRRGSVRSCRSPLIRAQSRLCLSSGSKEEGREERVLAECMCDGGRKGWIKPCCVYACMCYTSISESHPTHGLKLQFEATTTVLYLLLNQCPVAARIHNWRLPSFSVISHVIASTFLLRLTKKKKKAGCHHHNHHHHYQVLFNISNFFFFNQFLGCCCQSWRLSDYHCVYL